MKDNLCTHRWAFRRKWTQAFQAAQVARNAATQASTENAAQNTPSVTLPSFASPETVPGNSNSSVYTATNLPSPSLFANI